MRTFDQAQIRCFLVDDHPLFVSALADLLKADARFHVTGTARNGNEMLRELRMCPVDIVVLDLQLPDISGIELIGMIRVEALARKILVCSGLPSDEAIEMAFACGADAFIQKSVDGEELLATLLSIAEDHVPMNTHVGRVFREMIRYRRVHLKLSPCDLRILIGLTGHKSAKHLALELGISASAVYKAKSRIADRFGAQGQTDLRELAARLGLVPHRDKAGPFSLLTKVRR